VREDFSRSLKAKWCKGFGVADVERFSRSKIEAFCQNLPSRSIHRVLPESIDTGVEAHTRGSPRAPPEEPFETHAAPGRLDQLGDVDFLLGVFGFGCDAVERADLRECEVQLQLWWLSG